MKFLIVLLLIFTTSFAGEKSAESMYTIEDKNINGDQIIIEDNSYKILNFSKRIVDFRLSKSDFVSASFTDDGKPFSRIKIFAKKIGKVNALITFADKTTSQINFKIIPDISDVKSIIENIAQDVTALQVKDTIVLKGKVKNNTLKDQILLVLKESIPSVKVINLVTVEEPDKMVRLKLYVAEINNKEGETIKNNWSLTGFNENGLSVDTRTNMLNAVTLSGGITTTANLLGSNFDTGLTLNYLKENGVAKILDETTLVTLKNKAAEFLAGGTLLIQTSTTSAEGQPVSAITEIDYGLKLNITVTDIINDQFISLGVDTSSSSLDPSNGVGAIPAKKDKSVKTNVVVGNKATIVLGGLINNNSSKDFEKIPLLGDIPIIGTLFRSKDFQEGNSELIFFITPIIIDTAVNEQTNEYERIRKKILNHDTNKTDTAEEI